MSERTILALATLVGGGLLMLVVIACGTSSPSAETGIAIPEQPARDRPLLQPTAAIPTQTPWSTLTPTVVAPTQTPQPTLTPSPSPTVGTPMQTPRPTLTPSPSPAVATPMQTPRPTLATTPVPTVTTPTETPWPTITPSPSSTAAPRPATVKGCNDLYEIGWAVFWVSPSPDIGSGVLEQRVLQKDLVVRAEVMNVEFKAVEIDSIDFELKELAWDYEPYRYTLLGEVELRVHEYLKGEGPDLISAIVESQLVFNYPEAIDCAQQELDGEIGGLFDSSEGIALLESTNDPNLFHMGRAFDNFSWKDDDDSTWRSEYRHSTWLPYRDGSFNNRGSDGWISLAEVRRRVSGVLEEYNRSSDERWQRCVTYKYFVKGRDPWAYRGFHFSYEDYRDQTVVFAAEDVPVPAGTVVWISPDPYYADRSLKVSRSMILEGGHAELFEATHYSEYQYTANEWKGSEGELGPNYEAIWYKRRDGKADQFQMTRAALVVTAVKDLEEGEYTFNFEEHTGFDGQDPVDCGQDDGGPRLFKVIVDKDAKVGQ